jgi:hypothetical protein
MGAVAYAMSKARAAGAASAVAVKSRKA